MAPGTTAFDNAYDGTPTWDIGRPQPAVVRLADAGLIVGDVLDVGCGTGEDTLLLASRGHRVLGIDFAAAAIAKAQTKAVERGIQAEFAVGDARALEVLGRIFDTVLDVGCFHSLQPGDRPEYAASLRSVLRPGGRAFLLCWSNLNPFGYGPERIRRRDIQAAFRDAWTVESIGQETLETLLPAGRVHAWLATIRRD